MSDTTPGVPIGTFDHVATVVGQRGYGKSTLATALALQWRKEARGGAYIIGHSLGANLPIALPDGTKVDSEYHGSIESLDKGLRRRPRKLHILAEGTADVLIEYGRKLSKELRRRAWYREKGLFAKRWTPYSQMEGIKCMAIIVLIDEAVSLRSAQGKANAVSKKRSNSDDPKKEEEETDARWLRERLFRARHENMGYIFNIQNAQATGWVLLDQSTDIYAFHTMHEWALGALRASGYSQEQCEQIRVLPKYHHMHLRRAG